MDSKSMFKDFILLVCVVFFSVAGAILSVAQLWFLLALDALCLMGLFYLSFRRRKDEVRKLRFLIDAISNNDYMFSFGLNKDRYVNEQLNLIKSMLEKARNETIDRERYYELILDQMTSGVLVVDNRNHVLLVNSWLKCLFGIDQLSHLDNLSYYIPGLTEAFCQVQVGSSQNFTFTNEREKVNISIYLSQMWKDGVQLKIFAVHNIIDALNQNELDSWNKLSRVLTHEIMNSLAPIISLSESLKKKKDIFDPEIVEGLESIWYTSNALVRFVDNYRKLTHLPAVERRPVYVSELVERVVCLFRDTSHEYIDIQVNIEPRNLMFYVDERMVILLLSNLLKNSIESIGIDSGLIRVEGGSDQYENVVISVSDSGALIDSEVVDHIFIPFFTTKKEGSGIGLSLARQIMRLHSGSITLHQETFMKRFLLVFR